LSLQVGASRLQEALVVVDDQEAQRNLLGIPPIIASDVRARNSGWL
jgi:hypothetical protein